MVVNSPAQLFYMKIGTNNEKLAGTILDSGVSRIDLDQLPHTFSWEERFNAQEYSQEIKIRMQGVDRPLAELWNLQKKKTKVNWLIRTETVGWIFAGYVHSIEEGFVDGIFESNYVIRGFKIIKVDDYGATSRKRKHNNKNLRPLRRKKSSVATENTPGSKRNRTRVRKADLVQLPLGRKKRVRGKDAKIIRDRKSSGKPDGSKPKRSRS